MTNKQQRKKAREAVLQALYAIHLSQENEEKVLRDINERYNFDLATKEFIDELFRNTINDRKVLDAKIEGALENWDIERIAPIDRIIIKMSIVELNNFSEIPNVVTLNEYMEISKEYSTPKSSQFINGVLDSILKNLKKTD